VPIGLKLLLYPNLVADVPRKELLQSIIDFWVTKIKYCGGDVEVIKLQIKLAHPSNWGGGISFANLVVVD
jgi:hypothetical protein